MEKMHSIPHISHIRSTESSPALDWGRYRWLLVYTVLALLAFIFLTVWALQNPADPLDVQVTHIVQAWRDPILDRFMYLIGFAGLWPQVVALNAFVILILYVCRAKWESLTLLVLGPLVGILDTGLRYTLDRPRPSPDLVWVAQKIENLHYSYPSGHVIGFVAIFGFLMYIAWARLQPSWHRTLLLIAYGVLITLEAISRVYLGEHWASDVVGAWLIGSVFLVGLIFFYEWGYRHIYPRLAPHLP